MDPTIRRAMATLVPQFTTGRMVQEYTREYYLPRNPWPDARPSLAAKTPRPWRAVVDVRRSRCGATSSPITRDELVAGLAAWGQPAYRVDQLLAWLYESARARIGRR